MEHTPLETRLDLESLKSRSASQLHLYEQSASMFGQFTYSLCFGFLTCKWRYNELLRK